MDASDAPRKIELLRKLVSLGHGEVILHLLLGVSKYSISSESVELTYPASFEDRDRKGFHLMTWVHAHLEFTARFGSTATEAREGKISFWAHPAEYEEWLEHGAPGVCLEELEACARDLCSSVEREGPSKDEQL